MSFLAKMTLGLCLVSPVASFATEYNFCEVPVCSIQDTMRELRMMTPDQRGMYALNLKNTHKDSTDIQVLENLYRAGQEMKTLFAEMNDEAWIQRAASDLANTAVFSLARLNPINGEQLAYYYTELNNATFRYNLISHWQTKLTTLESVTDLEELIIFADAARTHSIKINDEDWISRAASSLISEISVKLTHLDPAHEGLYNVEIHGASKGIDALGFDRITILDSSSSKNLVISLINTRLKVIVHTFSQAEILGNTITGLSLPSGEMSTKFRLNLNRQTGEVDGMLESTRHGVTEFSGTQLVSTRSVFTGTPSQEVTVKDILGTMTGELGGVKGKLTIKSFKENVYSATFTSMNGSILINFQGKFYAKKGVLSFTSADKIKLTMSLRDNQWSGLSFSTTSGTHSKATFSTIK